MSLSALAIVLALIPNPPISSEQAHEEVREMKELILASEPEPEPEPAPPEPEHEHEPAPVRAVSMSVNWDALAACESDGQWDYGPHSGWGSGRFQGGLQFHPDTWDAYRPAGWPAEAWQASREQQIVVAEKVLAAQGLRAWPACTKALGWR